MLALGADHKVLFGVFGVEHIHTFHIRTKEKVFVCSDFPIQLELLVLDEAVFRYNGLYFFQRRDVSATNFRTPELMVLVLVFNQRPEVFFKTLCTVRMATLRQHLYLRFLLLKIIVTVAHATSKYNIIILFLLLGLLLVLCLFCTLFQVFYFLLLGLDVDFLKFYHVYYKIYIMN